MCICWRVPELVNLIMLHDQRHAWRSLASQNELWLQTCNTIHVLVVNNKLLLPPVLKNTFLSVQDGGILLYNLQYPYWCHQAYHNKAGTQEKQVECRTLLTCMLQISQAHLQRHKFLEGRMKWGRHRYEDQICCHWWEMALQGICRKTTKHNFLKYNYSTYNAS